MGSNGYIRTYNRSVRIFRDCEGLYCYDYLNRKSNDHYDTMEDIIDAIDNDRISYGDKLVSLLTNYK